MNRFTLRVITGIAFVGSFGSQLAIAQGFQRHEMPNGDPAAVPTMVQALNSAGGTAIAALQDLTASGDITFYWAGSEVKGSARVLARGTEAFRMDAELPGGTRSWSVINGSGTFKDVNGNSSVIPPHNAISLGSLTFPYFRLRKTATDSSTTVADSGDVTVGNVIVHKLHLHHDVDSSMGIDNPVNHLLDCDYLLDPETHLVTSIQNQTHPVSTMTRDVPHEVKFSDYRNINGLKIPFLITEYIGGQRTWMLQLSSIQFNTGVKDADFQF